MPLPLLHVAVVPRGRNSPVDQVGTVEDDLVEGVVELARPVRADSSPFSVELLKRHRLQGIPEPLPKLGLGLQGRDMEVGIEADSGLVAEPAEHTVDALRDLPGYRASRVSQGMDVDVEAVADLAARP